MSYQMQLFGFGMMGLALGFAGGFFAGGSFTAGFWHREVYRRSMRFRDTIAHLRQEIRELEVANEVVQSRPPASVGAADAEDKQAGTAGVALSPWESASGGEPPGAVPNEYSPASAEAMMRLWRESGTGIGLYVRLPNGNEPVYMGGMHDKVASSDTIEIAIGWLTQLKYEALLQEKGVPHGGHA